MFGKHHSVDTVEKIRKISLRFRHTKGTKRKLSRAHKGKHLSEKTKEKISEALKGEKSPHYGKHFSEEIRIKMREALKGKRSGKNNPNWLGGISFEPYGLEFDNKLKQKIRKRDNFTCQECGFTEKQLNYTLPIHHIDYNKKNNNENNLIALCKSCHMQTNYDRNDWTDYLQQKINSINNRKRYQNE